MASLSSIFSPLFVFFSLPPFKDKRFSQHSAITNRRLLWHGTNVAVVAAILKSGLRIMPHSGGRVGKGIYLASENSKSAAYGKVIEVKKGRNCIYIFWF